MSSQITTFTKRIRQYFFAYGGWSAVLRSPLFWLAFGVTILNYSSWFRDDWIATTQALIPNLLGFSLGTYAILFSFITSKMKRALKTVKNPQGISYLDEINATFFHFIFVQVLALLWAFIFRGTLLFDLAKIAITSWPHAMDVFGALYVMGSFLGFFLLVYAFLLILGAALAVYRLARIVEPSSD